MIQPHRRQPDPAAQYIGDVDQPRKRPPVIHLVIYAAAVVGLCIALTVPLLT